MTKLTLIAMLVLAISMTLRAADKAPPAGEAKLPPFAVPATQPTAPVENLWPGAAPGVPADLKGAEKWTARPNRPRQDRMVGGVTCPTVTLCLPPADKRTGAAVVICPGGGYGGLAIDKEGYDVAAWLNSVGVAGIVLKYRLPRADVPSTYWSMQDAQRAIRLVRHNAKQWNIDPQRIGIMGFSAGGHLAATVGTHFDSGKPDAADPLDRLSCRPDFMILVYPVISFDKSIGHSGSCKNLLGVKPDPKLVEYFCIDKQVTDKTPPTFLVHAKDDRVKVENSLLMQEALKKAGVPVQLELFEKGGHGFGLGVNGGQVDLWPGRCAEWLKQGGFLK